MSKVNVRRAGDCDGCPSTGVVVAEVQDNDRNGHARLCVNCLIEAAIAVAEERGDSLHIKHTFAKPPKQKVKQSA